MKTCIGTVLVLTVLSTAPVLAEDYNNPAASYPSAASAAAANSGQPASINDGNNPAPNYPAMANATSASPSRATQHSSVRHKTRHVTHRHHAKAHS